MTKSPSFSMTINTRFLIQRLGKSNIGEKISYKELSELVGSPVNGSTTALTTARRHLLRHRDMVFGVVRAVGLERLDDKNIVHRQDGHIASIRRKAKKGTRELAAVQDYAAMEPKDQLNHTLKASLFHAISHISSERHIKKLAPVATGRSSELPIRETLQAFIKEATSK